MVKAEARRGESILVHDGCSAIGQAAIRVATQLGCSPIFVTVASQKERDLVHKMFPQLEPCHLLVTTPEGSFEFRLRLLTADKGVRIVVNTLAGQGLQASLRCLGHFSRLLHYRREDILAARTIGTTPLPSPPLPCPPLASPRCRARCGEAAAPLRCACVWTWTKDTIMRRNAASFGRQICSFARCLLPRS